MKCSEEALLEDANLSFVYTALPLGKAWYKLPEKVDVDGSRDNDVQQLKLFGVVADDKGRHAAASGYSAKCGVKFFGRHIRKKLEVNSTADKINNYEYLSLRVVDCKRAAGVHSHILEWQCSHV